MRLTHRFSARCAAVVLALTTALGPPSNLAAVTITGAESVPLFSSTVDGTAAFDVDEFGNIRGCGDDGIMFDPIGPLGAMQADCSTTLYVVDFAAPFQQALADLEWQYFATCGGQTQQLIDATVHVTQDFTTGTDTRASQFKMPGYPDVDVRLGQWVCGSQLRQTYEFKNNSPFPRTLRLTRVGDLDLLFTNGFVRNWGAEYPIGSASPIGSVVLDDSEEYSVALTHPPTAVNPAQNATFDGWRIHAGSVGAATHPEAWTYAGYTPGSTGADGLDAIYTQDPGWCDYFGSTRVATNLAAYHALAYPPQDIGAIIQSSLTIGPGMTRRYITETIAEPGLRCCNAAPGCTCNTITGTVYLCSNNACDPNPNPPPPTFPPSTGNVKAGAGWIVRVGNVAPYYYAVTDANGNWSVTVPSCAASTYNVSLVTPISSPCPKTLTGVAAGSTGVNFCVEPNECHATVNMFGDYPPGLTPPNVCTVRPWTPCPNSPWRYCVDFINDGTLAFDAGTKLNIDLGPCMVNTPGNHTTATHSCPFLTNLVGQTNTGGWAWHITGTNTFPVGSKCTICVEPDVICLGTPWLTTASIDDANCEFDVTYQEGIQCACDPNSIQVTPVGCNGAGEIEPQELTYLIRFHNVGTGPASTVVVRSPIDAALNIESLRLGGTSHTVSDINIVDSDDFPGQYILEFIYAGLNLAPVGDPDHPEGGEGYLTYRLSPHEAAPAGTQITAAASIYFDRNPAVDTNDVLNTLVEVADCLAGKPPASASSASSASSRGVAK